jgi:hypothetical protein
MSSAGVAELICADPAAYVERAIEFGLDRTKLQTFRDRLRDCRSSSVLFDTPRLVRTLEERFKEMWRAYADGSQTPPDLTNLPLYRDIAIEFDAQRAELMSVEDYLDFYRRRLQQLSDYTFIPRDGRAHR